MKKQLVVLTLTVTLLAAPAFAAARQMDPNMPGMQHDAKPADVQGSGIVKAIDTAKGTVTLKHQAIPSIQWPAMTMTFKVASPDLLKSTKVGDTVNFGLHPAGMNSTVTSISPAK
jgi:Uncharacterized conserved protein